MGAHRSELREKVEGRQKLLEEALRVSEADATQTARISALSTQLQVLSDSVGGGWEHMTDVTAERLTGWLESTRTLLQGGNPERASLVVPPQPAHEKLAGRDKIN
jgi:hypothetical protein